MKTISEGQISSQPGPAGDSYPGWRDRDAERIKRVLDPALPLFNPLHKVSDLLFRVVRAFGNDGLVSAVFLQICHHGPLVGGHRAALGSLHLDPQAPSRNIKIRDASHDALRLQPVGR